MPWGPKLPARDLSLRPQDRGAAARGNRWLAPVAVVIPTRMRINSEHAVDAANHPASRSANNPTNKATDRSEHAVTGISTAVSPVVHPPRHALRLCGDRRGEKEGDSNHTEHSHLVSLFSLDELLLRREFPLYQDPDHVGDLFAAHRTPGLQADVQINRHVDSEPLHGPAYDDTHIGPRLRVAWLEWDRLHAAIGTITRLNVG